jgi:serine/threonine-protein kinase
MGSVYRATDQLLQRPVAIKILKEQSGDEFGKRIRLEAQILARLLHDNVVRLYDLGIADGLFYLVMEEVSGSSYQRRWRQLQLTDRLRILAQVADALDYAHRQGVIHRDVKPANVLLTTTDQPKLSDFGLSLLVEQGGETLVIRGTPAYMSPEQGRGRVLDYRTDLYSLGVVLYESMVEVIPFQGKTMEVIAQHVNATPPLPRSRKPEISERMEAMILRLLSKRPQDRPASGALVASTLRDEIEAITQPRREPTPSIALSLGATAATMPLPRSPEGASAAAQAVLPRPMPPPAIPAASRLSPLAREMLDAILAEPMALTPEERFLCGHYLAYLLGGSRRRGILLRRPLDPVNANRARLMLAMTWATLDEPTVETIERAAQLLDQRPEVRSVLSPVVVAKYLAARDTPEKRKRFRETRRRLHEASDVAQKSMTDARGLLNPGLMPLTLDDLKRIAPTRTEVDDELVARWNNVAEVWRVNPDFRQSVLRYATLFAHRDPASAELWPEVVYPLIERARWQRRFRSGTEKVVDEICEHVLRVPDAGVRMDQAVRKVVPEKVIEALDVSLSALVDEFALENESSPPEAEAPEVDKLTRIGSTSASLHAMVDDVAPVERGMVPLAQPDPSRFTMNDLRELWQEAIANLRQRTANKAPHRHVAIGPYRITVIPTVRGRSAGEVAIQGMRNKQIEMLVPSFRAGGSGGRYVVAVWLYQDNSLVITYLDFQKIERYILWYAPTGQQTNFTLAAELNHTLLQVGLEHPDQLDRVLSRRFRPRKPA